LIVKKLIYSIVTRYVATIVVLLGLCWFLFSHLGETHFLNYAAREYYFQLVQDRHISKANADISEIKVIGFDDKFCDPEGDLNEKKCPVKSNITRMSITKVVSQLSDEIEETEDKPNAVLFDIILRKDECTDDDTFNLAKALYRLSQQTNLVIPYDYNVSVDGMLEIQETIFESCAPKLSAHFDDFSLSDDNIFFGEPGLVDLHVSGRTDHILTHREAFLLAKGENPRLANVPSLSLALYLASLNVEKAPQVNCDILGGYLQKGEDGDTIPSLKSELSCLTFAFHLRPDLKYPTFDDTKNSTSKANINEQVCGLLSVPCVQSDSFDTALMLSFRLPLKYNLLEKGGFQYVSASSQRFLTSESKTKVILIGSTNVGYDDLFLTPAGNMPGVAVLGNGFYDFSTNGFLKKSDYSKQLRNALKFTSLAYFISALLALTIFFVLRGIFFCFCKLRKIEFTSLREIAAKKPLYLADRFSLYWPIGMMVSAYILYRVRTSSIEKEFAAGEISISVLLLWASIAAVFPAIEYFFRTTIALFSKETSD